MPDSLFTWDALQTLAGAAFLCFLIVAYTKRYVDRWWPGASTDLYAVLIGATVLLAAMLAAGQGFTWQVVLLALFNGFLVAATAGKLHDKTLQERNRKDEQGAL